MSKMGFKERLELFKNMFYRRCLFCEIMAEGEGFKETESKTILSLCEHCLKRYEAINRLGNDRVANYHQIIEVRNCFYGKCYFCKEKTITQPMGPLNQIELEVEIKIFGEISACQSCYSRFNVLYELEAEKRQHQEYQAPNTTT